MKTRITVLCAVALVVLAVAEKKDTPKPVAEAPQVVVNPHQLEKQEGLWYFEGKAFTGIVVKKYDNRQKAYESTLKDGKEHGRVTSWYRDGQKQGEVTYKDGKLVSQAVWKPNGEKCPVTNIVNGNGITCRYYENGQKAYEITYKDNNFDGLWTDWYENGQKKKEATYKDGKMDGLCTRWLDNGQKQGEASYKKGKRHGTEIYFYFEDGPKRWETPWVNGQKHGTAITYNEDGSKFREVVYENGEEISKKNY